jgi:hypothetical protein
MWPTTPVGSERIVARTRTEAHRLIEGGDARRQTSARPTSSSARSTSLYRVHEAQAERWSCCDLPEGARARPLDRRRSTSGGVPGDRRRDQGPSRRGADPHHAAPLHAAGDLHRRQQRPLRTRLRGLHALHEPDPALPGPARAPRHQGAARGAPLRAQGARGQLRSRGSARAGCPQRRRRRRSPSIRSSRRVARSTRGRPPAPIAAPTSGGPTRPRATSKPGSSVATCASASARSSAAPSPR